MKPALRAIIDAGEARHAAEIEAKVAEVEARKDTEFPDLADGFEAQRQFALPLARMYIYEDKTIEEIAEHIGETVEETLSLLDVGDWNIETLEACKATGVPETVKRMLLG